MDLISRERAIDQAMGRANYVDTIFDKPTESEIVYMLRSIPTVPAVPLDELCEMLESIMAHIPCVLCEKIMPEWCKEHKPNDCPTWKDVLTKWMVKQDD